jgi:hypothetical protein
MVATRKSSFRMFRGKGRTSFFDGTEWQPVPMLHTSPPGCVSAPGLSAHGSTPLSLHVQ